MIFLDLLSKKYLIHRYERDYKRNIRKYARPGMTRSQIDREVNKVNWSRDFKRENAYRSLIPFEEYDELLQCFMNIYLNNDANYHSRRRNKLVLIYIDIIFHFIRHIQWVDYFIKNPRDVIGRYIYIKKQKRKYKKEHKESELE